MAKIVYTDELNLKSLDAVEQDWIYNAKDCCVTYTVDQSLDPRMDENRARIYRFELAQQAVAFSMVRTGLRVNLNARDSILNELTGQRQRLLDYINNLATAMWKRPLNPKSPKQMQEFFYDYLGLPVVYNKGKGQKTPTTNVQALESFLSYFYVKPIVNAILASGDLHGQIKVLAAGIDPDGRFRASFNVGGTETGRWSSSKNPHGRGTNLQNITERARCIFIADEGMIFVNPDLEQAESRVVAYLSGDENYIRACESGDLHTTVARDIWKDKDWTGVLATDRAIASRPGYYRHWSMRDLSKRAGHLTNYYGSEWQLARSLNLEKQTAIDFQQDYFTNYPKIKTWHSDISRELQTTRQLATPLGRVRTFFDRPDSESTLKDAIAFVPQSTIGDLLNLGLLKVWYWLELRERLIKCQLQLHDGFMAGVPEDDLDIIVPRMKELLAIPIKVNGRVMQIPVDVKVGYNWRDMKAYGSEAASKLKRDDTTYDPTTWVAR